MLINYDLKSVAKRQILSSNELSWLLDESILSPTVTFGNEYNKNATSCLWVFSYMVHKEIINLMPLSSFQFQFCETKTTMQWIFNVLWLDDCLAAYCESFYGLLFESNP